MPMGGERNAADDSKYNRRRFVQSALATSLGGVSTKTVDAAADEPDEADDQDRILVDQGDETIEIEPLETDQTAGEFFYGGVPDADLSRDGISARRSSGVSAASIDISPGESQLLFHRGVDGLSLVLRHKRSPLSLRGLVQLALVQTPAGGAWVLVSGTPSDEISLPDSVGMRWDLPPRVRPVGGYYTGLDGEFSFLVAPFHWFGINGWSLVDGDGTEYSLDMTEPLVIRTPGATDVPSPSIVEEVPHPEVIDYELPPTGVEIDEPVRFSITVDPDGAAVDDFDSNTHADLTRRGDSVRRTSAEYEATELSDGAIKFDFTLEPAEELHGSPAGLGYEISFDLRTELRSFDEFEGETVPEKARTYAFEQVDSVALVPARASDITPSPTGDDLFRELRQTAEFVCEHYASGLGSMGAHGFEFAFVTRDIDEGWITLSDERSEYDDGGNDENQDNSIDFVQEALDTAADDHDVNFSDYTTAFVLSKNRLSKPFYRGALWPDDVEFVLIEFGRIPIAIPKEILIDAMGLIGPAPYTTSTGRVDGAYDEIDGTAWRHELGHSLGPNNQVGFLDLYESSFGNLGEIGPWGLMGGSKYYQYDTISSFNRWTGGDMAKPWDTWLEPNASFHFLDDTEIELSPLTEAEIGDEYTPFISIYGEFKVDIGFGTGISNPVDVDITPDNFHVRPYIIEARKGGKSHITDPRDDRDLMRSPSNHDGVAIYRIDGFDVDGEIKVKELLDGATVVEPDYTPPALDAVEVDGVTPLALEYVPPEPDIINEPTISLDRPSAETYEDDDAVLTFELTDSVDSGSPTVTVERDPESLLGYAGKHVVRVIGELEEYVSDFMDDIEGITAGGDPLPGLDVLAETPDGRRAGVDPETGEIYEEIDGASVSGTIRNRMVSVPGTEDVTVTVSAERLKSDLRERDIEPPEELSYQRTVIVDNDLSIRDVDGIPVIDGRTRQTVSTTTGGEDEDEVALVSGTVDIAPNRINVNSQGQFVTATLEFGDHDLDFESIAVESVLLDDIQAVTDEQYGFVRNPVAEDDDSADVMVKFDRQEVIDSYAVGTHEVIVTGVIGDVTFQAAAEIELFEPGSKRGE